MEKRYLIKPFLTKNYPIIDYGKGIFLYDKDGNEFLDGSSGAVTANIGHGNEDIIDAMHAQSKKISFVYRSQFTNEPAEKLAKVLSDLAPGSLNWSFFVNSGTEAIETAMKVALQHWQEKQKPEKQVFISRRLSYHGITIGALSLSGFITRRERFEPLLENYPSLSPPYCYRCPFHSTYPKCHLQCAEELEDIIERIGAKYIAAFVAEPIIGAAGGAISPPNGYYQKVKEICNRYNILFIADEVMTGMGRTGKMFAIEHWGIIPDIMAIGKGLSGGYAPIAATLISDEVMEPIEKGSNVIMSGHTFSANPQSCATALAVVHYTLKNKIIEEVKAKGELLMKKLAPLNKRFSFIGDVRGKGLLIGVEFVENIRLKKPYPRTWNVTQLVIDHAYEVGLLLYPAASGQNGLDNNGILIAPPLTITEKEIDLLVERFAKALISTEQSLTQLERS
ncbi:aspartate aminotransferase family protein [Alkalihalobacterium elongatum]|uniref:aspartate aminotransferase family protein n=1 Tax=Alkalihalobacterium elongatum TaxID=2675466 RepID=UPI001C1FFE86|nr:aspartate aminotransferase family protein [Alkalihalobacterium elongatum]